MERSVLVETAVGSVAELSAVSGSAVLAVTEAVLVKLEVRAAST